MPLQAATAMRALSAAELLGAWDHASGRPPADAALALLAAATPDAAPDALAALPVGRRDARLLRLRRAAWGPSLPCEARCPACGERLEFDLDADALLASAPRDEAPAAPLRVGHGGATWTVGLPTTADLQAAAGDGAALLARCLLDGDAAPDSGARTAIADAVADADPLAALDLALDCPACGHAWSEPFDPAAYVLADVASAAGRLLKEVHALAVAYGWTERDVLALSPARRRAYLTLLHG